MDSSVTGTMYADVMRPMMLCIRGSSLQRLLTILWQCNSQIIATMLAAMFGNFSKIKIIFISERKPLCSSSLNFNLYENDQVVRVIVYYTVVDTKCIVKFY